jgi:hypothetical protein
MRWPTKIETVSKVSLGKGSPAISYGAELLLDGLMNDPTANRWTEYNGAYCDLVWGRFLFPTPIVPPYTIRVKRSGAAGNFRIGVQQVVPVLTIGKQYRVTGWAASNGTETPRIFGNPAADYWIGGATTGWSPFDFIIVADATSIRFGLETANIGGLVSYDGCSVTEAITAIAYYDMKPAGDIVPDLSVKGNDATIEGPTHSRTILGDAMQFDGVDDTLDITGITSTSQTYTFSLWLNSNTPASTNQFLLDVETGRLILGFFTATNGVIGFHDGVWHDIGASPNDGLWHHLVYLFDSANTVARLYIDGAQLGADQGYTPRNIGAQVAIGSRYSKDSSFFEGTIANFAMYEEVMTTAWITAEYAKGLPAGWHSDW